MSSNFWVQLVWGLCACGQHTVNFFSLVGANYNLVLAESIWHLPLQRLNPVLLQVLTFNTPCGELRWRMGHSVLQGNWCNRSLDG